MKFETAEYYPLTCENDFEYTFHCQGKDGDVKEMIRFKHKHKNLYELELLVYVEHLDTYALNTKFQGKDTKMIYCTLFVAIIIFSTRTGNNVLVTGYTPAHARLFAIFTARYFDIVRKYFVVYEINEENQMVPYEVNKRVEKLIFWLREDCAPSEYLLDELTMNE